MKADGGVIIQTKGFDLARTLLCGQAFRWKEQDGGFFGVCADKPLFIRQDADRLYLSCPPAEELFWTRYFSLDRDYAPLEEMLACAEETAHCLPYSRGIRILRQDPFETLISFILSANNNFARICSLVDRLCVAFGEPIEYGGRTVRAFPTPQTLAQAPQKEFQSLGMGYRAPYVAQSAQRVADGYDLEALKSLPFTQAKKELLTFAGVGPKVAECIQLFSLGFDEAFPVDVWVNRVVEYLYPGEDGKIAAKVAAQRFSSWAGPAQQYLFHYARQVGLGKPIGKPAGKTPRKKNGENAS